MNKENKEKELGYWIENGELSNLLDKMNLPEPLREKLEKVTHDNVKKGFFVTEDPSVVADKLIDEIFRRILGFSTNRLSSADQTEIERLKKEFLGDHYREKFHNELTP